MRKRRRTFKNALNSAIRLGLGPNTQPVRSYTTPKHMGPARVDLVKALGLAASFEDEAIARRLTEGR